MTLEQIINNIYPVPHNSTLLLQEYITEVEFPKGHILLKADRIETKIYFIKKGIVRAYTSTADNDITFWFGLEADTIVSMKSYVEQKKGYENIALLEDCILYELDTQHLQKLFTEDIHIANWGRRFAEKELIKTEERLISRQFRTAAERYKELLQYQPNLIQRVALGHIASYLGITQVSLSRIRGEMR